jgi:hypothetical protein
MIFTLKIVHEMGFLLNKTPFLKMRGRTEKLFDLSLRCIIRDLLGPCPGCRLISGSTLPVPCDGGNIGHLSFPLRLSAGSTWPGLPPSKGPMAGGIRLASLGSLDYENSTNSGD